MLNNKLFCKTFFLCLAFLLALPFPLLANERITSFDSQVYIDQSGKLTVMETISVVAEGNNIKRGIYRDFPTDYTNKAGMHVRVPFRVLDVRRDGKKEPYHTEQQTNGTRVYIGKENVFLKPGSYTYSLTYQTDRQIGFFPGYDEIYWNVTGNDWAFPIEEASATIILPDQANILQYSAYTGRKGSKATDAEVIDLTGNTIQFRTTLPLHPGEGLTVAVAWPKGIVPEPDAMAKASVLMQDNLTVISGIIGLCILFFYYIIVWLKVGKDPESGTIFPRFEPPAGFTPAAARFVMRMGFDNKTFATAIVSMAVKKYLSIRDDDATFTLTKMKTAQPDHLFRGEKKVANKLFSGSSTLELKKSNHRKISESITALKKSLQNDFEKLHFKRNALYTVPGLIITVFIIGSIILTAPQKELAGFMSVWLSGWSIGCAALLYTVFTAWKAVFSGHSDLGEKGGAIFISLFALPFFGGWFLGLYALSTATSWLSIIVLLVIIGVNIIFYYLLRAPTINGRKIMDQLEGLKLYLSVAEKDRLNILNPPEKTPALFEKFLPWALALDVEQQWSEQFSDIIAKAMKDGSYEPVWFNNHRPFSASAMASSLGSSLASTISSSSTAPGSSSGSGGGGSSGGGGGGGGGGGW